MNSHQKSGGKKCRYNLSALFLTSLVMVIGLSTGCTLFDRDSHAGPTEEVSLTEDQQTLAELRKNIPAEVRRENDQLKEILSMMGEVKEHPSKIRNRFNTLVRRQRRDHQREMRKTRDAFYKDAKKTREKFLKQLKDERDSFNRTEHDREERKAFYDEQDRKRKEFFATQKDERKDFVADQRDKSRTFNGEMTEKMRAFNQEHRIYSRRYRENEQQKKKEKNQSQTRSSNNVSSSAGLKPVLKEFEEMKAIPGTRLKPEDQ